MSRVKVNTSWLLYTAPPMALAIGLLLQGNGVPLAAALCAAITIWCAIWWVFEVVPLAVTALVPFACLPLGGVLSHAQVATAYGHTLILLMLAGSIVAKAMERSGAHRRVAIAMVRFVGGMSDRRLVLGFLLAAAVLSMWISNTATTVMLMPVAIAAMDAMKNRETLAAPLLLAITYGAAVGGSATPIGTPPNLIFIDNYFAATGVEIGFAQWMWMTVPIVALMLPIVWLWLTRTFRRRPSVRGLPDAAPWSTDQKRVLGVLAVTALGWLTRSAPFGGWSTLLGADAYVGDSTVALLAVIALFVLPSGRDDRQRLLDWETARSIPWGVFVMIGGGLAIGMGFRESNLSGILGDLLAPIAQMPTLLTLLVLTLFATFFTEVTSNTAVANILLPIMAAMGVAADIDPVLVMLPVTIAMNFAFMLPVATANNAIVYGTGEIPAGRMVREGFALNLIGAALISLVCLLVL